MIENISLFYLKNIYNMILKKKKKKEKYIIYV